MGKKIVNKGILEEFFYEGWDVLRDNFLWMFYVYNIVFFEEKLYFFG